MLGEAVLEFEGDDWKAVDEQCQIEGELLVVVAVPQLPGDGEAVLGVALLGQCVAWCGRAEEQVDVVGGQVVDAFAQDVDDAAVADLVLQPVEELASRVVVLVQGEGCGDLGLRCVQKG